MTRDRSAAQRFGLHHVQGTKIDLGHDLVLDRPGVVCWAGNSGMQAINLAYHWGARRLVLVGFDMRADLGLHWHGRHPAGLNNPTPKSLARWRERLDRQAPRLAAAGVTVINASPVSALSAYPRLTLDAALRHLAGKETAWA